MLDGDILAVTGYLLLQCPTIEYATNINLYLPVIKADLPERDIPLVQDKLLNRDTYSMGWGMTIAYPTSIPFVTKQILFGETIHKMTWPVSNDTFLYNHNIAAPQLIAQSVTICYTLLSCIFEKAYRFVNGWYSVFWRFVFIYNQVVHWTIVNLIFMYRSGWYSLLTQYALLYLDDAKEVILLCRKISMYIRRCLYRCADFKWLLQEVLCGRIITNTGCKFVVQFHYILFLTIVALYIIGFQCCCLSGGIICDSRLMNYYIGQVPGVESTIGGAPRKIRYSFDEIKPYIPLGLVNIPSDASEILYEYVSHVLTKDADIYLSKHPTDIGCYAINLLMLVSKLTLKDIKKLALCHGVYVPSRLPLLDVRELFGHHHECRWDKEYITIFHPYNENQPIALAQVKTKLRQETNVNNKKAYDKKRYKKASRKKKGEPSIHSSAFHRRVQNKKIAKDNMKKFIARKERQTKFPPPPPSKLLIHRIISKFCKETSPDSFIETGCAVCGELRPISELTLLDQTKSDITLLVGEDVTRLQRRKVSDPILEIKGPILDMNCKHICVDCESSLISGKIPLRSLANGLWIGDIPDELKDLSFAERILIAKVRHNRCVMRVSSGRIRMRANAVMFSNPTVKVYHKLPPTLDELDEVLAFVYIGTCKPTDADFERTPMLVRRNKIANALEWLKLNHCDYADLEISKENLDSYPLNGVPVTVEYTELDEQATNQVPGTLSSHDELQDEGTDSGPCPFSVHGMTGADYAGISMNAIKVKALKHLADKGKTLKVGHDDVPQSMYNNPQAYPQMFP